MTSLSWEPGAGYPPDGTGEKAPDRWLRLSRMSRTTSGSRSRSCFSARRSCAWSSCRSRAAGSCRIVRRILRDESAAYTGAVHAAATSSCTTALHIAVAALALNPGDEVIPGFTWISTANVVEYTGARPFSVTSTCPTSNSRTRCDRAARDGADGRDPAGARVRACQRRWTTSWSAPASTPFGSSRTALLVGRSVTAAATRMFGDFGCFSFHARKSVTTGEGGISRPRAPVRQPLLSLREHGSSRDERSRHTTVSSSSPVRQNRLHLSHD